MDSNNKTALITGGSSGLGLEFAKLFAQRKMNLVLASRNRNKLNDTGDQLKKEYGITVTVIPCDLSKSGEAERLAAECDKQNLQIDILVNNAGSALFGQVIELDVSGIEAMLNLNIGSLTTLCSIFGKQMAERRNGHILNIGSLAGNQPTPYFASYAASKSYVTNYSIALNSELKSSNVKVSCLLPGYISTEFDNNAGIKSKNYKTFSERNSMSPQAVAQRGINLLYSRKVYSVAGFANKIAALFSGLLPKTLLSGILKSSVSAMIKKS